MMEDVLSRRSMVLVDTQRKKEQESMNGGTIR